MGNALNLLFVLLLFLVVWIPVKIPSLLLTLRANGFLCTQEETTMLMSNKTVSLCFMFYFGVLFFEEICDVTPLCRRMIHSNMISHKFLASTLLKSDDCISVFSFRSTVSPVLLSEFSKNHHSIAISNRIILQVSRLG